MMSLPTGPGALLSVEPGRLDYVSVHEFSLPVSIDFV